MGATEVWEIANLTEDAHPIHVHLIQFQIINRQALDVESYEPVWETGFPGGTYGGVTYPPGVLIPGFGPPLDYNTPNAAGASAGVLQPPVSSVRAHAPHARAHVDDVRRHRGNTQHAP